MGAGASNHVKQITIDQNDQQWDKYTGSRRTQSQSGGSTGSRGLSAVGERIRRSACLLTSYSSNDANTDQQRDPFQNSLGSRSSADRARREQHLRAALEAADKRAADAENRVRQLERELATLELRNIDLASEVTWLKQQVGRPEVPVCDRPVTALSRPGTSLAKQNSTDNDSDMVSRLQAKSKKYEQEISLLKSQLQRDTQHLRAQLEDYRHGTGEQIRVLEQQLCYSSKLNQRLEDVVRINLSEGACVDAKSAAQNDVVNEKLNTSSSSSDHLLNKSGNNRAQLILELSNEISEKTDLIKRLEEDIVRRDLEIAHMKEITNTADSVMQAGHFHSKTQTTKSSGMPPPRPGSGSGQRQSFTARRTDPKASEQKNYLPLKVERRTPGGKVVDEIEALLKTPEPPRSPEPPRTPQPTKERQMNGDRRPSSENESTIVEPPLALTPVPELNEVNKQNVRVVSTMPKKSDGMKNVFTLSDAMEPVRVMETPRAPSNLHRPATADTIRSVTPNKSPNVKTYEDSHTGETTTGFSVIGRGASAPMLFKPSQSRANRRRRDHKTLRDASKGDNADLQSIYGDDDHDTDSSLPDKKHASPIPKNASNISLSGSIKDSTDDDEAMEIFHEPTPHYPSYAHGAVPRPTSKGGRFRKWDSGSAKSRDSGYLGDSMSGLAAHQMYHNEDQENAAAIR